MVNGNGIQLEMAHADLGYDGQAILKNISLTIRSGEIVCLLGPNGVGKTTLFKTILGFIPPIAGEVSIGSVPISRFSPKDFAKLVAYVPQAHHTPFPYKVKDVVLFGRAVHLGMFGRPGKKDRAVAAQALELLEIAHLAERAFTELSGGERQMVIFARALTQQARFIILDEPTSSLDYGNQVRVIRKIKSLCNQSIGILMSTHMPDHAFMLGAKVMVMDKGQLYRFGEPDKTLTPETLKKIYGVDVQVFDTPKNGVPSRKVCAPILDA
ncbi:ABC transporter-related protein [Chloroherpeton thalassium ATCC 35110]|uniref:ABC transporter-related protein n=1 Tax=Chloroherpeton thalassium (strain ATCC 35110 / GB-78) TaxID=517418 RepID=B3QXE6_CHLT3|nr:ABC transporter ATP-binding protein [Chloroherpeton thalassium]ACF13420.1 ABC transporter-related protein [Chloroherpeton thalassium ATCC 35110]